MENNLPKIASKVIDQESFLTFVRALLQERLDAVDAERKHPSEPYGPDAGGWENTDIETFLEAAIAWAEGSDFGATLHFHDELSIAANPWRQFAYFLLAGSRYE